MEQIFQDLSANFPVSQVVGRFVIGLVILNEVLVISLMTGILGF